MSDERVVKYDEMGVMDGGTIGLAREMNRDIWLREVFPEWGSFLNYEIANFEVPNGTGCLWYFGGPSYALKSQAGAVFTVDLYSGPSILRTILTAVFAAPAVLKNCTGCASIRM
jgi:hypothetical protein